MRPLWALGEDRALTVHGAAVIRRDETGYIWVTDRGNDFGMRAASELVLPGFPLKTDAKVVTHPNRWIDPRGERMWGTVHRLLEKVSTSPRKNHASQF